ncbi:MAG: M20/M25/M40 family metallo-hydrolase [Acidobacteriaceae bacterium]|nr:M20/M25/M40 family metallo-hydrolase [Acidobacteriaceae bacterium]
MATQTKTLLPHPARLSAEMRAVADLAGQPAIAQAQRWLASERVWINDQHLQLCRIPAPTFFEQQRAEWFRDRLGDLGWNSRLDRAGNVLATFDAARLPVVVLSAHLDTVLAPSRPEDIQLAPDGRLIGPGVSDNGSGLSALLALARLLAEIPELHPLAGAVLLVANVGEEGEGNLSGMRYLCEQTAQISGIEAFIILDGPSTDHVTSQALASRRFELSFSGPGGHSWNDHGTPNPVHALSQLISDFVDTAEAKADARRPTRCSYNFGLVEGGTSINSIPAAARAKLDLRSEDPELLEEMTSLLAPAMERGLERENRSARVGRLTAKLKELGSRPGGKLDPAAPLLRAVQAVDAHLTIRSRLDCASTDANVPLSLGLPAISIGVGGSGGGAHTGQEWYHPDGRDLGLRRILLVLAALVQRHSSGIHVHPAE